MIEICLLGCGGVMPLPDRALTSLFISHNGSAILLDCGEGTQTALRREKVKYSRVDTVLLTHLHGDHICGLPGLLLTYGLENRTEPLNIYGPQGVRTVINAMQVIAPGLPYEIICHELTDETVTFGEIGLQITAFKVQHSVPCYGYRFDLPRLPKFDSERARSLNIPVKYWKALQNGESIGGYSPSDVQGEAREGIGLLYATDTRPIDNIVKHGKNLKLMILEGMYDDPIMKEKAEQTSHSTMQESVALAALCRPSQLWLTHFSPSVEAPTEREHELKKEFNNTVIGYDGLSATLVF